MSTTYEFKQYEILIQDQNSLLGETFPRVFFFLVFMDIWSIQDKKSVKYMLMIYTDWKRLVYRKLNMIFHLT